MAEKPDRGRGDLMLSLQRLLDLALDLAQYRMVPARQVKRKDGCRPLKEPRGPQQGAGITAGIAGTRARGDGCTGARRRRKRQATSRLQHHVWYQLRVVGVGVGAAGDARARPRQRQRRLRVVFSTRNWSHHLHARYYCYTTPPIGRVSPVCLSRAGISSCRASPLTFVFFTFVP